MDSKNQNLELLNVAIKRLVEERKFTETSGENSASGDDYEDNDEHLLLSRLLSQLESLKEEQEVIRKSETKSDRVVEENCRDGTKEGLVKSENAGNIDKEEIMKEFKKVERQNSVTHWLLSIMIVLTVAWQVSEVSLILKVKNGLSDGLRHPFKYLGGALTSMLKRSRSAATNGKDDDEKGGNNLAEVIPPLPPPLKTPELPHVELPDLSPNGKRR